MSAGMFEGLEGLALAGDASEQYAPGALTFDQDYVEALADAYAEDARFRTIDYRPDPARQGKEDLAALLARLPAHIAGSGAFDCQGFLSAIADALRSRMPVDNVHATYDFCSDAYLLFSPIVRELQRAGQGFLYLDISDWHCAPRHLIDSIEASAEKPFFMRLVLPRYSLPAVLIGEGSKHCVASVSGSFLDIGEASEHCDFTFERTTVRLGKNSRGSTYRLASAADITVGIRKSRESTAARVSDSGAVYLKFYGPYTLGYRASVELQDGHRTSLNLPDSFFWDGNRLLVPDGNGGWKEVLP